MSQLDRRFAGEQVRVLLEDQENFSPVDSFKKYDAQKKEEAAGYPLGYPVEQFLKACHSETKLSLEEYLPRLCLDPGITLKSGPWYYVALIDDLKTHLSQQITEQTSGLVVTDIGKRIVETLRYTAKARASRSLRAMRESGRVSRPVRGVKRSRPGALYRSAGGQ